MTSEKDFYAVQHSIDYDNKSRIAVSDLLQVTFYLPFQLQCLLALKTDT